MRKPRSVDPSPKKERFVNGSRYFEPGMPWAAPVKSVRIDSRPMNRMISAAEMVTIAR